MLNFIKKYSLIIAIYLAFFNIGAFGGNLQLLEKDFLLAQQKLQETENHLQKSRDKYNQLIGHIDSLKINNAASAEIQSAMKQALQLANEIEKLDHKFKEQQQQINQIKNELYLIYNNKIDSLTTNNNNPEKTDIKETIKKDLIILMQKRLKVMPHFQHITFKPQVLAHLNSAIAKDSLELLFRLDYLQSSLSDVEESLNRLEKLQNEVKQQLLLDEQTELFLDDLDNQPFIAVGEANLSTTKSIEDVKERDFDNNPAAENISLQSSTAINQLFDYVNSFPFKSNTDFQNITHLEEYEKIIEKIKEYLKLYRKLIKDKLKAAQTQN